MARCKMRNARPKAPLGTTIGIASLGLNLLGQGIGLWNSHKQQQAQADAMQRELDLQKRQLNLQNLNNQATALNNGVLAQQYDEPKYYEYANGGRVSNRNIAITDGGYGIPLDNNTFLLRGSSHEDVNESGRTGIGLAVGNKEVEAEGGEVIQRTPTEARIFSDNIQMPNGMSPSEYVQAGGDSDLAFRWQEAFKKHYGLNDNGTMKRNKLRSVSGLNRRKALWGDVLPWATAGVGALGAIFSRSQSRGSYKNQRDILANYERFLNSGATSPYMGGGYQSMNTDFRNLAKHSYVENLRRDENKDIYRNTASASTALGRTNQTNTNALLEQNKIFDEDAQRNLQARIEDNQARNQYNMNLINAANQFNTAKMNAFADLYGKRLAVEDSKYSDNTAMWQNLYNVTHDLSQYYINKEADERQMDLALPMADGNTTPYLLNRGLLNGRQIEGVYNEALEAYNNNPTEENLKKLTSIYNYSGNKRWNKNKSLKYALPSRPSSSISTPINTTLSQYIGRPEPGARIPSYYYYR